MKNLKIVFLIYSFILSTSMHIFADDSGITLQAPIKSLKKNLAKGSIISLPEEFAVYVNGQLNLELTIYNWLRSDVPVNTELSPIKHPEESFYLFPVKVVKAARGSSAQNGSVEYIDLTQLKKGALPADQWEIVEDNHFSRTNIKPLQKIENPSQAEGHVPTCTNCNNPAFVDFQEQIQTALKAAQKALSKKQQRVQKDRDLLPETLQKSCGLRLSDIESQMNQLFGNDAILVDIFIKKMVTESSGYCRGRINTTREPNGTVSSGLFQINARSKSIRNCSSQESQILSSMFNKGTSMIELKAAPKCLQNPYYNLIEAHRVYQEKERSIFGTINIEKNISPIERRDRERMIVAGYNAGEAYTIKAREDLLNFNKTNKTNLDPNNWEQLKPFYFRQVLNSSEDQKLFKGQSGKALRRRYKLLLSNLAHAETIVNF